MNKYLLPILLLLSINNIQAMDLEELESAFNTTPKDNDSQDPVRRLRRVFSAAIKNKDKECVLASFSLIQNLKEEAFDWFIIGGQGCTTLLHNIVPIDNDGTLTKIFLDGIRKTLGREDDPFYEDYMGRFILKQDCQGCTALHYSVQNIEGYTATKILLEYAKNIMYQDPTLFNRFINMKSYHIPKKLDVSFYAYEGGQTALHIAIFNGNLEIVKYLLENGARIDIPNMSWYTPLNWAQAMACEETEDLELQAKRSKIKDLLENYAVI